VTILPGEREQLYEKPFVVFIGRVVADFMGSSVLPIQDHRTTQVLNGSWKGCSRG